MSNSATTSHEPKSHERRPRCEDIYGTTKDIHGSIGKYHRTTDGRIF